MIRNYKLSHKLVASMLLLSLFLQSCGNSFNQLTPQEESPDEISGSSKDIDIEPLVGHQLITTGDYLASFYEDAGELKANLKVDEKKPKPNYKAVPVIVEKGADLTSLTKLDATTQKNRIELNRCHSGQLRYITIRKGGISGGMKRSLIKKGDEDQEEEKEQQKEKNLIAEDFKNYKKQVRLAMKGDSEAQFKLGKRAYKVWQEEKREDELLEAEEWLNKAAAQEHQGAVALLKEINSLTLLKRQLTLKKENKNKKRKDGLSDNDIQHRKHLLERARHGEDMAQFELGEWAYNAWKRQHSEGDVDEALHWLLQAKAQGYLPAIKLLQEVEVDHPELIKIIEEQLAKRKKDHNQQGEKEVVGKRKDKEKEKEEKRQKELLKRDLMDEDYQMWLESAKQNKPDAQYQMARKTRVIWDVCRDKKMLHKSIKWCRKAARQEHEGAKITLRYLKKEELELELDLDREFFGINTRPYTYDEALYALKDNGLQVKAVDLTKVKLTKEKLSALGQVLNENFVVGYIHWGEIPEDCQELQEQISKKLKDNKDISTYQTCELALKGLPTNDPKKKFIDLRQEKLTKKQLEKLKEAIDNNFVIMWICWGEILENCQKLKEEIKIKLKKNISTYQAYASTLEGLPTNDPKKKFIDLRQEKLTKKQLEKLKEAIDNNFVVGYIEWGEVLEDCQELKKQIEEKLVQNICNYTYNPTDYVHGLLSNHSYDEPKVGDKIDLKDLAEKLGHESPTSTWEIVQVQEDTNDSGFYSALYVNKSTHQAVLAFQGTYPDLKKPGRVVKDLVIEDMIGVLGNAVTKQQELVYIATKDAVDYAKRSGFNLSITGHSLGGYLAELGIAFCYLDFDYREVKGIVFDSPGTDRKLHTFQSSVINPSTEFKIGNLPITAYLSAPNFVNSCNGHPGEVYRVYPKLKGPDWANKFVERAQSLSIVGPIIETGNKSSVALLGHSLIIILSEFDSTTGKPKEYVRVKDWPKLNTDKIEHVGKESKLNTLLKPYLGDVSAATSSMVNVLRDLLTLTRGAKQYWTTLVHLDEDYKEKVLNPHNEFKHKYVGHYQTSPISIDAHPLNIDGYESIDGFLYALWEDRKEIGGLQINDIIGTVLKDILQDYTIKDLEGKPCLLLTEKQTQIQALRDKMQRAKDVLTSTRIKETLKHSKNHAVFNYVVQEFSKKLQEESIKQSSKLHSYIPVAKLPHYVDRKSEQQELSQKLQKEGICVIYGHGGVGKSSLVAHYGHEQKSKQPVWWISAETWDKLIRSCENIAQELGINYQALVQEFKDDPSKYLPELARKVYNALEDRRQPALIILDNALNSTLIAECLMNRPDLVQVIITTRDKKSFKEYSQVELKAFTSEEGKKYIQESLRSLNPSEQEIERLIKTVGLIPLELTTAVGYIDEGKNKTIFVNDIPRYKGIRRCIDELEKKSGSLRGVNLGLKTLNGPLQLMMQYGSYLDSDFIPLSLVSMLLEINNGQEQELDDVLDKLRRLSLIEIIDDGSNRQGIRIHQEIQSACKKYQDWNEENKLSKQDLIRNLVQILAKVMPEVDRVPDTKWDQARLYASNITSILAYATEMINPELAELLNYVGKYNQYVVHNYKQALSDYKQAYEMRQNLHTGNHPDIAASLNNIGNVYFDLRQDQEALKYYEQALEIRQDLHTGNHPDIAVSLNNIGNAYWHLRNHSKALEYYEKALEMEKALYTGNHPDVAMSLNGIGNVYSDLNQHKETLKYYKQALEMRQALYTGNHPHIANSLNNIGNVYYALGQDQEALKYHEQALAMRQALYTGNHPDIANSLSNIGIVYKDLGQNQEALKYYEQALEMRKVLYTGNHPEIANSLDNIGNVYRALGQNQEALKYFQQALEIKKAFYTGNHPDIANSLGNIGNVYYALGQHKEALTYYEQALGMRQAFYTGNHPEIASSLNNIGLVYNALGQHQEALKYHEQALGMRQALYSGNHPDIAGSLNSIGNVYRALGQHQEALKYHEQALEMRQALYTDNHPDIAMSLNNIGAVYNDLGQNQEALKYYEQALEMRQALYTGNHSDIAMSLNNIGAVYNDLGQNQEALKYYEQALEMRQALYTDNHSDIASSLNSIGSAYNALGQNQEALKYYEQALEMRQALYTGNHSDIAMSLNNIGAVYNDLGQNQEALKYYEQALEMRQALYTDNHSDIADSFNSIGLAYRELNQPQEALKWHQQTLKIMQILCRDHHPDMIKLLNNIGEDYFKLGQNQEALKYYEQALEMRKTLYTDNHPDIAISLHGIGNVYFNLGQHWEALRYYEKALGIFQALYTDNHPLIDMVRIDIARLKEKREKAKESI